MAEYRTDEEQLEALKNWWSENGNSLLIGIALAIAIVLGWQAWQQSTQSNALAAANLYENYAQELTQALAQAQSQAQSESGGDELSADATALLSAQLSEEHSGSLYAVLANLGEAKIAVAREDYSLAASQLRQVLDANLSESWNALARLRLARVKLQQGEHETALAELEAISVPAFKQMSEELKGDVYQAMGDTEEARAAYQAAVDASEDGIASGFLEQKLETL